MVFPFGVFGCWPLAVGCSLARNYQPKLRLRLEPRLRLELKLRLRLELKLRLRLRLEHNLTLDPIQLTTPYSLLTPTKQCLMHDSRQKTDILRNAKNNIYN